MRTRAIRNEAKTAISVLVMLAVFGCSTTPDSDIGSSDPRFVWPCDRLLLQWQADAEALAGLAGSSVAVRQVDGTGTLNLNILHCASTRDPAEEPFAYAYLSVQLDPASIPIVISDVAEDSWFATDQIFTTAGARGAFEQLHYPVSPVEIQYQVIASNTGLTLNTQLDFAEGSISISSEARDPAENFAESAALIHDGVMGFSVYFGRGSGARRDMQVTTISSSGTTPLTPFNLAAKPDGNWLDTKLKSNRIHWRLPAASADQ